MKRLLRVSLPGGAYRSLARLWHRLRKLDPRVVRRRAAFDRQNRGAPRDEIVVRPGLGLKVDPRSREPFEWFCFRSREMAEELDAFVLRSGGKTRLLDVGACHGIFSLVFTHGRPDRRSLAVEPSPIAHEVLQRNLELNARGNVLPVRAAAGAGSGSLRMRPNWHHLEAVPEGDAAEGDVVVPVRALDEICAELGFRPDVIKIDVEGYEQSVLEGARELLARERPILLLEVHPDRLRELGRSPATLARLLEDAGYRTSTLRGRAFHARAFAARASVFRVVCLPRDREAG